MENKALEQRLESLAQEQLIKYMEHEVLEREIVRLRALYQQQQQQQQHQHQQHQHQQHMAGDGSLIGAHSQSQQPKQTPQLWQNTY